MIFTLCFNPFLGYVTASAFGVARGWLAQQRAAGAPP